MLVAARCLLCSAVHPSALSILPCENSGLIYMIADNRKEPASADATRNSEFETGNRIKGTCVTGSSRSRLGAAGDLVFLVVLHN